MGTPRPRSRPLLFFQAPHSFILLSTRPSTRRAPTRTHALLVRLIRPPAELELVDLQRAEQRTRGQRERDLRRAGRARVLIAARERTSQRRGSARGQGGTGGTGGGGKGERPAQRASRGHVHPLAAARRARRVVV
jgi:hypothetical protein